MWATENAGLSVGALSAPLPSNGWSQLVNDFWQADAGASLKAKLTESLAQGAQIYPPSPLRALDLTPLDAVRVVIVGQDPYHQPGQANGLAFSVGPAQKRPPSLRNILEEVARDCGQTCILDGQLEPWATQGVLLLNSVLTVERDAPASHRGWGWESLSRAVLQAVHNQNRAVAFVLWGADAQKLAPMIHAPQHRVWTANHPSPLSARRPPQPFVGCGHFSQINRWLVDQGQAPIRW